MDKGKPEPGKEYALTGKTGDKCIANGNTWAESEVKENDVLGAGTRQTEKNKTGSKRPLPFECIILKGKEEIQNPYSGEKVWLEPDAVAVYDCIKGAEMLADPNNGDDPKWETVRKGLDWFRKHFPKEYMVLLD